MSSKRYETALTIKLNPSQILKRLLIGSYALTTGFLLISHLDPWITSIALSMLLFKGIQHYECYLRHNTPHDIKSLQWQENGHCLIHFNNHEICPVHSISSIFYSRWCIGLYLHLNNKRMALLIPVDMLDKDSFRRLYLRLKIQSL